MVLDIGRSAAIGTIRTHLAGVGEVELPELAALNAGEGFRGEDVIACSIVEVNIVRGLAGALLNLPDVAGEELPGWVACVFVAVGLVGSRVGFAVAVAGLPD